MYMASFPDGTINAIDLPPDIREQLYRHVDSTGALDSSIGPVHGSYIDWCGYRVNVTIYEVTDITYKVRLA